MKITTTIIALLFAFLLAACNNGTSKKVKTVYAQANGHYIIEPFTLEGECANPDPFEIVIWQNEIFDNPENSALQVEGELIKGQRIEALATTADGTLATFTANLDDYQSISGEWELLDGGCSGYVTGSRIVEL